MKSCLDQLEEIKNHQYLGLLPTNLDYKMPPKVKNDEEAITATQVRDLLEQQKSVYVELLKQQEASYKGFVQLLMESFTKRMDDLTKDLCDFKASLHFTQGEVENVKASSEKLSKDCKVMLNDINMLNSKHNLMNGKIDYLENQYRCKNLIFDGIPESVHKKWSDSEDKIQKILNEKLKLDQKHIELERVHRSGKPPARDEKPRPIVVRFLRFKDRNTVLEKAKNLKGSNIYVNEDFSEAVRMKRKELIPATKEARKRGDIAYLRFDKLITHRPTSQAKD